MAKPEWLIEREREKSRPSPRLCKDCIYYGRVVRKHKTKRNGRVTFIDIHECDIHKGCYNGDIAMCCDDWVGASYKPVL